VRCFITHDCANGPYIPAFCVTVLLPFQARACPDTLTDQQGVGPGSQLPHRRWSAASYCTTPHQVFQLSGQLDAAGCQPAGFQHDHLLLRAIAALHRNWLRHPHHAGHPDWLCHQHVALLTQHGMALHQATCLSFLSFSFLLNSAPLHPSYDLN